jgi:hypothetical protein
MDRVVQYHPITEARQVAILSGVLVPLMKFGAWTKKIGAKTAFEMLQFLWISHD